MDHEESAYTLFADSSRWRHFRLALALRAVEDALRLLDPAPADGLEIRALERVRDDLEVILRIDALERGS